MCCLQNWLSGEMWWLGGIFVQYLLLIQVRFIKNMTRKIWGVWYKMERCFFGQKKANIVSGNMGFIHRMHLHNRKTKAFDNIVIIIAHVFCKFFPIFLKISPKPSFSLHYKHDYAKHVPNILYNLKYYFGIKGKDVIFWRSLLATTADVLY